MAIKPEILSHIENQLYNDEFRVSEINKVDENSELEDFIDMMDSVRNRKDYDWQSDIAIPEFAAHMLTQASIDANTNFSTRDFTEVYVQDESDEAMAQAEAQKELINRTLNQEHLFYYQKFMRAKMTSNIAGRCYVRTDWEKSTKLGKVGSQEVLKDGEVKMKPILGDVIDRDRFNFEVIDNRNVVSDNTYVYSMNDKRWVYIRSETSLNDLKLEADQKEYFGIDDLAREPDNTETEASKNSYNQIEQLGKVQAISPEMDKLERFGKYWAIVTKRDESDGHPIKISPGIDSEGKPLPKAELVETIITFVKDHSGVHVIGFKATPFVDALGNPFKPIIRGLNYIHPTMDGGIGDGQYAKDIQVGINDTFNMSNDRVRFATTPIVKLNKGDNSDLMDLEFYPGAVWDLNSADDVEALQVSDNIQGSIQQIGMLTNQLDKTTSIFPSTQGQLPEAASTTATAVAGAETRSNQRGNYRALTFEHTFQKELYWHIAQMTLRFAEEETGQLLMGEKQVDFEPSRADYTYKPVSQAVETEFSKNSKIQKYTQLLQIVGQVPNPKTAVLMNRIIVKIFELMGDEAVNTKGALLDEEAAAQQAQAEAQQQQDAQGLDGFENAPSNQNGIPQGDQQAAVREGAPG